MKEMDEIASQLLKSMREAAYNDLEFNKNNQPAIAKLKLLPEVEIQFRKYLV